MISKFIGDAGEKTQNRNSRREVVFYHACRTLAFPIVSSHFSIEALAIK